VVDFRGGKSDLAQAYINPKDALKAAGLRSRPL
jgi:hypothetical protein